MSSIELNDEVLKKLAKEIVAQLCSDDAFRSSIFDNKTMKKMSKSIATEMRQAEYLVTARDIALLCGLGENSSVVRKMMDDPTFPPPAEVTEGGHKRYRRKDVIRWIDNKFDALERAAKQAYLLGSRRQA